ncbi:RcnB family protein [Roseibium aestuarii]|uniref:RcnB family protein n=1 Tax=Roseibium aestuarii TaxID=2600299 RepID=A0ABW4JWT0_9HYPH|nr:RcnB family protein [Roseibium aestuarii]
MTQFRKLSAAALALTIGLGGIASAQAAGKGPERPMPIVKIEKARKDHKVAKSEKWRHKGGKMPKASIGAEVDYRKHGLRKPPAGHRWVRHGNDYVLVAIGTGIIASIIAVTH